MNKFDTLKSEQRHLSDGVPETMGLWVHRAVSWIGNLILTPHIAGVTDDSNTRVSKMIADLVLDRLK